MESKTHLTRLNINLEVYEISLKVGHRIIHILFCHTPVGHNVLLVRRGIKGWVLERVERVVPPDVVPGWIRSNYVLEPAGRDLVIVVGIAPAANAVRRIIKEGGIEHIMCVWMKIVTMTSATRLCWPHLSSNPSKALLRYNCT